MHMAFLVLPLVGACVSTGAPTRASEHPSPSDTADKVGGPTGNDFPTTPTVADDWIDVTAGLVSSCGVHSTGQIECWGAPSIVTQNPPAGTNYVAVSVGYHFACALSNNGRIDCWCNDGYEYFCPQLDGTFSKLQLYSSEGCAINDVGEPVCWPIAAPTLPNPVEIIATGNGMGCALEYGSSEPLCWPYYPDLPEQPQTSPPAVAFTDIALAFRGGCGVEPSGTVLCLLGRHRIRHGISGGSL